MKKNSKSRKKTSAGKSTISNSGTYTEIADFWDKHDLSDYWSKTRSVGAEIDLESEESLYSVEKELSQTIQRVAKKQGISPDTLLNLWLQEKIQKLKLRS